MTADIPRPPDAPSRPHKRSMQALALAVVLALPLAFLAWGSFLLKPLGLSPDVPSGQIVSEDLSQVQAEARLALEQAAAEDARRERQAAMELDVPAYDPNRSFTLGPGQTVVSLSFDDGLAGAAAMAEIAADAGLRGTFYVNSGLLDLPGYLTLRQAKELAAAGHEIGGHTVSHQELVGMDRAEASREICQDRSNLLSWGFSPTNFAYPFASGNEGVEQQVAACGYNSARALGGTASAACADCPPAEDLMPAEPYFLRAPEQVESDWTLQDLQEQVLQAPAGSWTILTFHGMCPIECDYISVEEDLFREFVAWLAERTAQGGTVVKTVQEVVGGPLRGPVPAAIPAPAPPGVNGVRNAAVEQWSEDLPICWQQGGFGDNDRVYGTAEGVEGSLAMQVKVNSYRDGDAKFVTRQDLGECAIPVLPGHRYSLRAWYKSDARSQFSLYYRDGEGRWHYWTASSLLPQSSTYRQGSWTSPPVPEGATALSFGLGLVSDGTLISDDFALFDVDGAPPTAEGAEQVDDGAPHDGG